MIKPRVAASAMRGLGSRHVRSRRLIRFVRTPERTTAAAFSRYAAGEVVADSASLQWAGLYVRRYRFPRVVDRFLVPATPEPLISMQPRWLGGVPRARDRRSLGDAPD